MTVIKENNIDIKSDFLKTGVAKHLIILNMVLAIVYFLLILLVLQRGNSILFWMLIVGEIFHLWQLFTFLYTVWDTEYIHLMDETFMPTVDVFVTVCGEPSDIVENTIDSVLDMDYPLFKVYILNDGFVAKKNNWEEMERLAERKGVFCITRTIKGGAKAGNINNALKETQGRLVAVFDADHIPHRDFLSKTVGYFADPHMGFVQSPQYYKNFSRNKITEGAFEQQALFFGAICKGKNRLNSVTMCGTNMVIRRTALREVGNIYEKSIAEDFMTGLFLHRKGWKSCYVPEVLAEGLAPEDFLSYYKQQFRWARGSLDVIFRSTILFRPGLKFSQRLQYFSSLSYFLSGFIVLMNAAIPLVFFFTGLVPLSISTMALAAIFMPYIFVTMFVLQASTNYSYSFKSLALSMAAFNVHISAIFASILGGNNSFSVTSKKQIDGSFLNLVVPQMIYIAVFVLGTVIAVMRYGMTASVLSNFAWALLNAIVFFEYVRLATRDVGAKSYQTL